MKMAKKFLAIALAGVLALSVLTGCGDSANTKSIAEAMSDMVKAEDITVKEKPELNTKAQEIVKLALADATETVALADNGPTKMEETMTEGLTPEQKKKIMTIMESYNDQFVGINWTETKGYNATTQAYNLLHGIKGVHAPDGKRRPADTCYIGTTTFTKNGTTYRFAVFTAEAQTPDGGDKVEKK